MGVNKNTPDPHPGVSFYVRDADGNATGWIKEKTYRKYRTQFFPVDQQANREGMDLFLDKASSVFNSHLVGCIVTDRFDRSTQMPFFRGVSEADVVNYNTYFADKNVLITASINELLRGDVVTSAENFTNTELSKTEFYADRRFL